VSARTKARKRALDILYVADLRELSIPQALAAEAERAANEPAREASWLYAREIVDGVADHKAEIDELIETYAQGWTLVRMPVVDRAILRIGIWELLHNPEVPTGVAISEAVEAAQDLSTDDSAGFINGLLAKIAQIAVRDDADAAAGPAE
jgi:N utilization substance protein B